MGLSDVILEGDALSIVQVAKNKVEDVSMDIFNRRYLIKETKTFLSSNPSWDS